MKHHNNLTDDQIHKPKGFQGAPNRSLMIKNSQGSLEWKEANYSSSVVITCIAGTNLHNMYFCLYNNHDTVKYAVHFKMDESSSTFFGGGAPDGYDSAIEVDCTSTGFDSTAVEVAIALNTAIDAHTDFSSTRTNEVVTITGLESAADPFDVSTDFTIVTTQTKVVNEVLTTDSDGDFKFVTKSALSSEIEDVEGTEVKSTGESGGTKYLREDGDGTCSWQTVSAGGIVTELTTTGTSGEATISSGILNIPQYSGGEGDITSVRLYADSGDPSTQSSGSAEFTIAGGTGLTTTSSGGDTITISFSEDKKSKSDIDSLTGVTGTNLGTFTGSTVSNSSTVKAVIQQIVTRVEEIVGVANANLGTFNEGIISADNSIKQAIQKLESHIKDVMGSASNDLGTFTGTVISANSDIKEAMQELETFADDIITRINALLGGETGNDLGTFTGDTIGDSKDVKAALQDLETRAEKRGSRTIQGIASFSAPDFKVTNGNVELDSRTEYVHTRFSTNNLDIKNTKIDGDGDNLWLVPEVNNNKDLMFSVPVDSLATLYEKGLRASLCVPLTDETWTLVGGKCIASGENGSSYEIAVYSGDLDAEQDTNVPLTNMGDFNITGSQNGNITHNNLVLDTTEANTRAVEGDGILIALRSVSDEDENTDYDMRGTITLKFEVVTA